MGKQRIGLIFLIMVVGMLADLLLIEHFESFWQFVPVIFLAVSGIGYFLVSKGTGINLFRAWMYTGMLSGVVGIYMHVKNNWEFAIELRSNLKGWELISEVATGAIPVISPGFLIPIAMLGLHVATQSKMDITN